jgi:hypothetical protein
VVHELTGSEASPDLPASCFAACMTNPALIIRSIGASKRNPSRIIFNRKVVGSTFTKGWGSDGHSFMGTVLLIPLARSVAIRSNDPWRLISAVETLACLSIFLNSVILSPLRCTMKGIEGTKACIRSSENHQKTWDHDGVM